MNLAGPNADATATTTKRTIDSIMIRKILLIIYENHMMKIMLIGL